ncbi:hypothetical protein E6Q11_03400 [Candidatus Dojkabacteria bacterium]|uniref:Uncharacterized protein n=1 Tax=Candidatus Dojkabacteria bacterium TaxID=2099670 RepID=A0A5C7J6F1_9BACT|nr:MAG: hypothetical protein E6Q11_03400 [Candidatus Dojkabacteria bacterium]
MGGEGIEPAVGSWINEEATKVVITIPARCRDNAWADNVADVQAVITTCATEFNPRKKIIFDFLDCRWIDPLPLMSVLLEISCAEKSGLEVEIRLPESDDNLSLENSGPYHKSPNRFLRFLHEEGFLDCLKKLECSGKPSDAERSRMDSITVQPSYEDARCIPMSLLFVPDESDKEYSKNQVDDLLKGIETKLISKKIPRHASVRLIYKLRVLLQELVHNTQEHAYQRKDIAKPVVIYARYRTGRLGLERNGIASFEKSMAEEVKSCVGLNKEWISTKTGCLEVFVIDRGMGMVRSYERHGNKLRETYKFREIVCNTYLSGISSRKSRETQYGGLYLLHSLFKDVGDYIRTMEDGVWVFSQVPLVRNSTQLHELSGARKRNVELKVLGLAAHYRLGWKTETDHGEKWAKFTEESKNDLWAELSLDETHCAESFEWFESQLVIDEQLGAVNFLGKKFNNQWILWLVRPHRMKNDITSFLERVVAEKAKEGAILVVADIPSYEAETYAAAISKFRTRKSNDWPKKFSRIILCTNRWRFASSSYEEEENKHGFSNLVENFEENRPSPPRINPKPKNFRLAIVRWIKWYQSKEIWSEIQKNKNIFISEKIHWGVDQNGDKCEIDGFLDFARSSRNPKCAHIYASSLARILGILPPDKVHMYPMDLLTMTVLSDINAEEVYEPADITPDTRLAVGSVLVSGATKKATGMTDQELYFFRHGSSQMQDSKSTLLFWMPTAEIKDANGVLMRVGKTATIAPHGWKSFEVYRFDHHRTLVGGCDPAKTYEDWQKLYPLIVKFGHWSYQGHHDLLTVNIKNAVDAAFLQKNELARFLIERILPFIGIGRVHLADDCKRLLGDEPQLRAREKRSDRHGILVYRSHPNTEAIIRRLLDTLTPEGRSLAAERIFPILPVRARSSGSTMLIPPLVREELRAAVRTKADFRSVLIFDDAAISGRTLQDLSAALRAIGARDIASLVIVNRWRLPSINGGEAQLDYYWRLDVPVMGRAGNCPLCHAISLARQFAAALCSKDKKDEINSWISSWEAAAPHSNWHRGLTPIVLDKPEIGKRYCCRLSSNDESTEIEFLTAINITRSTGLAINISELHAMTGRDDYFVRKASRHGQPDVRLEIAASQLLLFGHELDADVRAELVKVLISELPKVDGRSERAGLASLSIMLAIGMFEGAVQSLSAVLEGISEWTMASNECCRTLLAYFTKSGLLRDTSEAYKVGKRLLSAEQLPLASRLREIYSETLSPLGNPHSEAIPSLRSDIKDGKDISERKFQNAIESLLHLEDLVGGIDRSLVRKDALPSYDNDLAQWRAHSDAAKILMMQAKNLQDKAQFPEIYDAIDLYLKSIRAVASAYFHIMFRLKHEAPGPVLAKTLKDQIISKIDWQQAVVGKSQINDSRRVVQVSSNIGTEFHPSAYEAWFAWYEGITQALIFLVQNAIYASHEIPDPWNNLSDDKAHMWVKIDFKCDTLTITFANSHLDKTNSEEIWQSMSKKKNRWSAIEDIGGAVRPESGSLQTSRQIMAIEISIPYAGFMESTKG